MKTLTKQGMKLMKEVGTLNEQLLEVDFLPIF